MARGDTAARQIRLWMLLLQSRHLSYEQAAAELGCAVRTVYRDLEGLQRAGIPLYQEKVGKVMRWKLVEGFNKSLVVQLTVQEAMALAAGERLLSAMKGTFFEVSARQAMGKVKHALAPEIRQRVEALGRVLSAQGAPPRRLARHGPVLDQLLKHVGNLEVVVIQYRKLDAAESGSYTIEPHFVHVHGSSVYVIAWARERNAPRIFLLDRIEALKATGEQFERRAKLGEGIFAQGAFGLWDGLPVAVKLHFLGSAARIVAEQEFHPSQTVTRNADGSIFLEFVQPISPALLSWIRGFGKRVRVLDPKGLLDG